MEAEVIAPHPVQINRKHQRKLKEMEEALRHQCPN